MKLLKPYHNINENLENLWKTYVYKIDPITASKIKSFIDKKTMDINFYKNITSDITNTIMKDLNDIKIESSEDSEKIRKIGSKMFIFLTTIDVFISNISSRYPKKQELYKPVNIFKNAKSPVKEIFMYSEDDFSKNLNTNIIKVLSTWGNELHLSSDGLNKIKSFKLFESQTENILITTYISNFTNMMNYIRSYTINKLNEVSRTQV